jgi:hypothetical protein
MGGDLPRERQLSSPPASAAAIELQIEGFSATINMIGAIPKQNLMYVF